MSEIDKHQRRLSPLIALALSCLLLGSCGASTPHKTVAAKPPAAKASAPAATTTGAATKPAPKNDIDHDGDNGNDDVNWGRAGTPADMRAMRALVKGYYARAAANDGAKACTLIYSIFADEIPETYGEGAGPPELRGQTCAAVMTKVFEHHHGELLADNAGFQVTRLRVRGLRGLAFLKRPGAPLREIPVHLEAGRWRIDALLDGAVLG